MFIHNNIIRWLRKEAEESGAYKDFLYEIQDALDELLEELDIQTIETKTIVNHLRKPIRCKDRGMTTADEPPANPHAFRLWCVGVPKGQAEFVKVRTK